MSAATNDPQPPSDAYRAMADLLPPSYFATQPPAAGVRLIVLGDDGIGTQWDMSKTLAQQVARVLARRRRGPRVVASKSYNDCIRGYVP